MDKKFLGGTLFLCLGYLLFECFYTSYAALSVDEFWFAHHIYQYKNGIPYRDFIPYKNVLAYYLLLIPMSLSHSVFGPLFYIKDALALINTCALAGIACWLRQFYPARAILLSLTLIVFSQVFLTYSTNIRIDLLAYWLSLATILFLFENRFILGGLCFGLGFFITPKTCWYFIAINCGLAYYWFSDIHSRRHILLFNLTVFIAIVAYIAFWSLFSNLQIVLHTVFYDAYIMSQLDWYSAARTLFWSIVTIDNPLLFLLWPITLISLFIRPSKEAVSKRRIFVLIVSWTFMLTFVSYKQAFPYNMLALVPVFFLLYTDFFAWFETISDQPTEMKLTLNKYLLVGLLLFYFAGLFFINMKLLLPAAYFLICSIPLAFCLYINKQKTLCSTLILLIILFTGVIYPTMRFIVLLPYADGKYQQAMVNAIKPLLAEGGGYVAGIPLLYNQDQAIPGLRHLMGPALDYLQQPSARLRPVMSMSSLYLIPATKEEVIQSLKKTPVKLFVNNYRMKNLPPMIKNYLASQYEQFWGSIYLYAPLIASGQHVIEIQFSGDYVVEGSSRVLLDRQASAPHAMIRLAKGEHLSVAANAYRLKLIPSNKLLNLDPHYRSDQWEKITAVDNI